MCKRVLFIVASVVLGVSGLARAQTPDRSAAMVVNPAALSAGFDQAMHDRLITMGFDVTVVPEDDVRNGVFTRADADTYDLLLVSESIGSARADPLIGTTTPTMHNESYGWDNWFLTTATNMRWAEGVSVDIVNATHPIAAMAAVKVGPMTFFNSGASWTTEAVSALAPGAELIAQITDAGAAAAIIFAVEEGAQLANGSAAPARIVAFSIPGNNAYAASVMTNEAWALFDAAIRWLTRSTTPATAKTPSPADSDKDVSMDVVLSWTPGEFANTHDVYFGTSFQDVNDDVALASPGQDANSYAPGRLEFGQTYFWRVDEVNAPPDSTVYKGNIWSFTTEPFAYPVTNVIATASIPPMQVGRGPEKTVDGSGLTDDRHSIAEADMWLGDATAGGPVWIRYDFDRPYKLHDVHIWNHNSMFETSIGFGVKSVTIEYATDTEDWTVLGDFEIARATGADTYTGTTVDLGGIIARSVRLHINSNWGGQMQYGLAEVRFSYVPVAARKPSPDLGATDVPLETTLSWRAGREADLHRVHFGADGNAVAEGAALVDTVAAATYSLGALNLGTTYYWKIDEVNDAATPSVWEGPVWDFTTKEYLVVEDFEAYTDQVGSEIFATWVDGYEDNSNGSQVGYENPPYAEKSVVHGGRQSMPLHYGKGGVTHSEAKCTFASAQDWTRAGIATLTLYVRGQADNVEGQFHVKVNGVAKAVAVDFAAETWQEVNVELASLGVDLKRVTSLALSVEGAASGLLFVDDIRLRP